MTFFCYQHLRNKATRGCILLSQDINYSLPSKQKSADSNRRLQIKMFILIKYIPIALQGTKILKFTTAVLYNNSQFIAQNYNLIYYLLHSYRYLSRYKYLHTYLLFTSYDFRNAKQDYSVITSQLYNKRHAVKFIKFSRCVL